MTALQRLHEGTQKERIEARIELYEMMIALEQENIRRLGVGATPHLADLRNELKTLYAELEEMEETK